MLLLKEGGREVSNKILYVGNLPKSVSEETIQELFSVGNPVKTIKILNDKTRQVSTMLLLNTIPMKLLIWL